MSDLYHLAAAVALELRQAAPGSQRNSLRALFDRLVDDEIIAGERNAAEADATVRRLLAAIDFGLEARA